MTDSCFRSVLDLFVTIFKNSSKLTLDVFTDESTVVLTDVLKVPGHLNFNIIILFMIFIYKSIYTDTHNTKF